MINNYSLFSNNCVAQFGWRNYIGKKVGDKVANDIKTTMAAGATQDVIDDVVKRTIDSGEKHVKQKVQRYGTKARRLWKASPKLRRNVKIAGGVGAGLVGLNALTGLKTVYDIGAGVKNKLTGKKKESNSSQYSLFNPFVIEFTQTQEQSKKKSLLKKSIKYGAIGGAGLAGIAGGRRLLGYGIKYKSNHWNPKLLAESKYTTRDPW
jgi:hypothetical protein